MDIWSPLPAFDWFNKYLMVSTCILSIWTVFDRFDKYLISSTCIWSQPALCQFDLYLINYMCFLLNQPELDWVNLYWITSTCIQSFFNWNNCQLVPTCLWSIQPVFDWLGLPGNIIDSIGIWSSIQVQPVDLINSSSTCIG